MARTARTVSRSAAPGPAPTNQSLAGRSVGRILYGFGWAEYPHELAGIFDRQTGEALFDGPLGSALATTEPAGAGRVARWAAGDRVEHHIAEPDQRDEFAE